MTTATLTSNNLPRELTASSNQPVFGLSITPYSNNVDAIFRLAKLAGESGLDIIGIQDHPYNGSFFDTWTLISALASSTRRIRFFPDVSDLPMRQPAVLAKSVATLDIITRDVLSWGLVLVGSGTLFGHGAGPGELLVRRWRRTRKRCR